MPPAGFEPTILASDRPQTHALDRAANGIGGLALRSSNKQNTLWTEKSFKESPTVYFMSFSSQNRKLGTTQIPLE